MALEKIRLGTNEDGSPHYLYRETDPTKGIVMTGPVNGEVTLTDGTVVEVSEPFISVPLDAAVEVADKIGEKLMEEGHPAFLADPTVPNDGFVVDTAPQEG